MSRPSTAASSIDLGALASFPLPPFFDTSSSSSSVELRQTSPPWAANWTAYRQALPSPPPPPSQTPDDDFNPHAEYFAATTPRRRRGSNENPYSTVFEFDEFDENTPALSSSSYSSRSRTSPFPSPTASSSSSIDSELFHNSPGRKDVGLGLWIVEQERKAAQMEQAMTQFTLSSSSGSSSSAYLDYRENNEETSLPPFDPFGCASPVQVQRASYIKFEPAPAPPVQQRVLRPVPIRAQPQPQTSLLPPAIITSQRSGTPSFSHSSPFAPRPSYVAPGPEPTPPSSSVSLSQTDLSQIASLHNGRVPSNEQMAPTPQVASNGLPPPIVNTGNHGAMIPQQGDWRCGTCTFVNWRRRKICMRCFPFASNDIGQSFAAQSQRAAYLASTPMTLSSSAPSFTPSSSSMSLPRAHVSPRKASLPDPRPLPLASSYGYSGPPPPSQYSDSTFYHGTPASPSYPSQYSLPPIPQPPHQDYYTQYQRPPFPPRTPCDDLLKVRRRVGGVIGYAGVAY